MSFKSGNPTESLEMDCGLTEAQMEQEVDNLDQSVIDEADNDNQLQQLFDNLAAENAQPGDQFDNHVQPQQPWPVHDAPQQPMPIHNAQRQPNPE